MKRYPTVLSIAGFDGSGGAGIQADTKAISALGCYAMNVLTALPIQNTQGVQKIYPIPLEAVKDQLHCLFDDILPDAIKIGMVHSQELVYCIIETLDLYPDIPVVFDPVMVSSSGHQLIQDDTIQTIIDELFPRATLITPNMDEAAVIAQMQITDVEDMIQAATRIPHQNLLLKGGHLQADTLSSILFTANAAAQFFNSEKIDTPNTHGSGCSLSAAIASYLALGNTLSEAVAHGLSYVYEAIKAGADVQTGKGHGPLNHFFNPQKLISR